MLDRGKCIRTFGKLESAMGSFFEGQNYCKLCQQMELFIKSNPSVPIFIVMSVAHFIYVLHEFCFYWSLQKEKVYEFDCH